MGEFHRQHRTAGFSRREQQSVIPILAVPFGETMKAAIEDVANRRPVWEALSELFLDTELQPADFQRLGRTLAASPYTLDEIEGILYDEVYPICIWNLRSVAGEWARFDSAWLREAILKGQRSRLKIPRFLQMGHWMIREPWQTIKDVFQERRRETCASGAEPDAAPDGGHIT